MSVRKPTTLLVTTIVPVLVAAGLLAFALTRPAGTTSGHGTIAAATSGQPATSPSSLSNTESADPADPYRQPEIAAARAIPGLTYRVEGRHNHATGVIQYDSTPPVGGDHSPYWADCAGTVYSSPIANENAVHMLEHGAVWITYNAQTLSASGLAELKLLVDGHDGLALSPYPNLKTPVSLQSWGYQLFVDDASDPRVQQFVTLFRYNRQTTPQYGAICSQPLFKQHPSTFGHPLSSP